jgi:hypothetical protein
MLETYAYSHCNICNILIYFYNIYTKYLQHTSETSATIETYVYNVGGENESGRFQPLGWEWAACDHHQHRGALMGAHWLGWRRYEEPRHLRPTAIAKGNTGGPWW